MSQINNTGKNISFTVAPEQAGQRLDVFLAQADEAFSRSQIKYAIEEGDVLVNGREPKVSQHLKAGDVVELHMEPAIEAVAVPQDVKLNIVYEDASIIVVNKPAGMVVHPAPGNPDQTLVNALLYHCHDLSGIGGVLRPGIVHRLDKETSGLIVAAKTDEAHRNLSKQFEKHDVHKKYIALVWGDIKGQGGEIVLPVGRHPVDRKKMSTKANTARMHSLCGKCANVLAWQRFWTLKSKPDGRTDPRSSVRTRLSGHWRYTIRQCLQAPDHKKCDAQGGNKSDAAAGPACGPAFIPSSAKRREAVF